MLRNLTLARCRRLMSKIDNYLCWWPDYEYDYDSLWDLRHSQNSLLGGFLWGSSGPRLLSEVIPHYTQCILTLLIAIERFILICYPTRAKEILSRPKRVATYISVTVLLLGISCYFWYHYWVLGHDFWHPRQNSFDNVSESFETSLI